MSNSISTLLLRNLSDVFGENDLARRRAALDELWNQDGVFYDPSKGAPFAVAIKATHPAFQWRPRKVAVGPSRPAAVFRRDRFPHR
jgi:hypothetical protein